MKNILSIIIAMFALALGAMGQTKTASPFNLKDSTYIKGKINGFKPGQEDGFISISVYNILGKSTKRSVQINNDGSFSTAIYQQFEGDIMLNYRNAFISLYAIPAEMLTLTINDALINRETGHRGAFVVNGKNAELNDLLTRFQTVQLTHTFKTSPDLGDKAQGDTGYANSRLARLDEELTLLTDFVKTNNVHHPTFTTWQKNHLMYEAAKDILFYPFLGKMNTTIDHQQLLGLIKAIPVNNNAALHNSAYYHFVEMLTGDQQIIVNINPVFEEKKKINGYNSVPLYITQIDAVAKGIARELMYYSLCYQYSKSKKIIPQDSLAQTVRDPYLKKLLDELASTPISFKPYDISAKIRSLRVNDTLKIKLAKLFDDRKGSNLHIDFWGDWCGPCMSEMPNYPATIARFKDKGLKFVFLSAFTKDESMHAVKAKFGIDAEFINLSNNEVAVLNNAFDFHSYPSHFIIDATGKVIANHTRSADQIADVLTPKQ